ncbi:MAG: hypothetical protein E6R03_13885 [Hyphomicrobiaceae bacterium]|nr:MAG: hypothetical protein E6R03_13885 [Hyphomicrobiaceae bacterium]
MAGRPKYLTEDERRAAQREASARWAANNPDRRRQSLQAYRSRISKLPKPADDTLKVCASCEAAKPLSEFYKSRNTLDGRGGTCRSCVSDQARAAKFGLSPAQFRAMWDDQAGECAICDDALVLGSKHGYAVDHDHTTGKVRGLLCHRCNFAVGHLRDNPLLCESAASYLRERA